MGPKKCVGPHMTTEKVYGWLDLKIFLYNFYIFKIRENENDNRSTIERLSWVKCPESQAFYTLLLLRIIKYPFNIPLISL